MNNGATPQRLRLKAAAALALCGLALLHPTLQVGERLVDPAMATITERVLDQARNVTLVVGPMLAVTVSGEVGYTVGTDTCLGTQRETLRSPPSSAVGVGTANCIVVEPLTAQVRVKLMFDDALDATETWTVERSDTGVTFLRPDGAPVVLYESHMLI